MPIRPENKALYPKNWPEISAGIRQRAGNRCEECGVKNYELGGRSKLGTWHPARPVERLLKLEYPRPGDFAFCVGVKDKLRIIRIVLTVAHLNHDPRDNDPENLKAWCQRCHNRYDAKHRAAGIKERRRLASAAADLFEAAK